MEKFKEELVNKLYSLPFDQTNEHNNIKYTQ